MPLENTIAKAQAALDSDDLSRAKEMIRSSLHNYNHEPKLLEFYGELLLQAQDTYQAGRYFFFSVNEVKPHQKEAVDLFLKRQLTNGYRGILTASPLPCAKTLSDFPPHARQHLLDLGVPEQLVKWHHKLIGICAPFGCIAMLLVFVGLSIVGLITVIRWIF